MRLISADVNSVRGARPKTAALCVGSGRAQLGLRAAYQRDLAEVARECGFRYLRFHGVLHDDMEIYNEDRSGNPSYNWCYLDELYDSILDKGMRPFVEFSFMPRPLISGPNTIFWWKGNVTPPSSYEKWAEMIRAVVRHWTERYGEAEVRQWYFEVWNEPDLASFFSADQAEYFKLYAWTSQAVKDVNPAYRVGGPATAESRWIPDFLDFCHARRLPLDFVSGHTYGVEEGALDEFGTSEQFLTNSPDTIVSRVRMVRDQVNASPFREIEIHFTEWNSSYSCRDPIHDVYQNATFVLEKLRQCESLVDSMSYWTFCDVFEESGPPHSPFHGGFGLINYQGIRKPSFFAYQYLNRLGNLMLHCEDARSWACRDENGGVQILFWDYTQLAPNESNQVLYKRDLPPGDLEPVHLAISGLTPGTYACAVYRTGYRLNDAYTEFLLMGSPSAPSREQVARLQQLTAGEPYEAGHIVIGEDGIYSRQFPMRENDIYLIALQRE